MSPAKSTAKSKKSKGFSAEERAAMKERAKELKAEAERGGRRKRPARQGRRDEGKRSRHGQAAPCHRQGQRAGPFAEDLVRDARVCEGRQGRLLLQERGEVQVEIRDVGFEEAANLDDGAMWPTSFALKKLTDTEEKKIVALVKKAVS